MSGQKHTCVEYTRKQMVPAKHKQNSLGILDGQNRRCFKRARFSNRGICIFYCLCLFVFAFEGVSLHVFVAFCCVFYVVRGVFVMCRYVCSLFLCVVHVV